MKKILIVNANYYKSVTDNLLKYTKKVLKDNKFNLSLQSVPGVFEIPIAIRKNIKKFDAFIALGCVIKGKTPHFDFICNSTFISLQNLSIKSKKPIGNGIITSLNMRQAKKRSFIKGQEAANAVIEVMKND